MNATWRTAGGGFSGGGDGNARGGDILELWLIKWLIRTYLVHLVAQIALIQAIDFIFNLDAATWLGNHRALVVFSLVVHFVAYLLAELLSVDRARLETLNRDRLGERDD